ncbi:hypothetical protein KA517_02380 [Candidatus Gracilibacteria bacterium]|nr:hypothetical protein [Candidatus Gracilibacteria bacterium]
MRYRYHSGEGAAAEEFQPRGTPPLGTRPLPGIKPDARREAVRNTLIPGRQQPTQPSPTPPPSSGVYTAKEAAELKVDDNPEVESFADVFPDFDDGTEELSTTNRPIPRISTIAPVEHPIATQPEAEIPAGTVFAPHLDVTRVSGEPTAVFSARLTSNPSVAPSTVDYIGFDQSRSALAARLATFDANAALDTEPAFSPDDLRFLDFSAPADNTVVETIEPDEVSGFHKKIVETPVAESQDVAIGNIPQSRFESLSLAEIEKGIRLSAVHDFLTPQEFDLASYVSNVHRDIAKHPYLALTIISQARKHHIKSQLAAQPESNPAQHAEAFGKMFQLTRARPVSEGVMGKAALEATYGQVIEDTATMVLHHCYLQKTGHYGVAINAFGLLPLLANYNDTLLVRQIFLKRIDTLSLTFPKTIAALTAKAETLRKFFHSRAESLGYYSSLAKADQALEGAVQTVVSHLSPIERPTFHAIYAAVAQSINQFQTTRARLLDAAQQLEVTFYTQVQSDDAGTQIGKAKQTVEQSAQTIINSLPAADRELFNRVYRPIKTSIDLFTRTLAKTRAQIRTIPLAARQSIIEAASQTLSTGQRAAFVSSCMRVAFEAKELPSRASIAALFAPNHTTPAGQDALPTLDVTAPETPESLSTKKQLAAKRLRATIQHLQDALQPEEVSLFVQAVTPTTPPQPIAPLALSGHKLFSSAPLRIAKPMPPFQTPPQTVLESLLPERLYNTWFPHLAALPGKIADTTSALAQALVRTVTPQAIAATAKALRLGHVAFALGFAALPMMSRPPKAPMHTLSQTGALESSSTADKAVFPTIVRSALSKIISPARRTVVNFQDERIAPTSVETLAEPHIDNSPAGAAYLQAQGYTAYQIEGDRDPYFAPASVYLDRYPNAASALSWYMNTSGFRKMYNYVRGPHDHSTMFAALSDHNKNILNTALQAGAEVTCGVTEDGNLAIQYVRFHSQQLLRRPIIFSTRSLREAGRLTLRTDTAAVPAQPVVKTTEPVEIRESRATFGAAIPYSRWQQVRNQFRNTATRLLRQIRTY